MLNSNSSLSSEITFYGNLILYTIWLDKNIYISIGFGILALLSLINIIVKN